jgi:Ca2+-binding EF-hand superfamily protein
MNYVHCAAVLVCLVVSSRVGAQPPGFGRGGDDRGGRGGFDPGSFLDRMDNNRNGNLDPDEQVGPISGLIERLRSFDSEIEPGKSVSIDRIKKAFEKMREGGGFGDGGRDRGRDRDDGGRDNNRGRDDRGGWQEWRKQDAKDLTAELLVPGFGEVMMPSLLRGFGATAEIMSTSYTERDLEEANERLREFDKNKDGFITSDEITPIFSGNAMDFDFNRDGRLSASEMAVRQARRRETKEEREDQEKKRRDAENKQSSSDAAEPEDRFGGRRSYRVLGGRSVEGVPGFFTDKDTNKDGQLTMAEFASEWSDDLIAEFADYDFDSDGVIQSSEAVRAVEDGKASEVVVRGSSDAASLPENNPWDLMSTSTSTSNTPRTSAASGVSGSLQPADGKYIAHAKSLISKYDENKDQTLTLSEMKRMIMKPTGADFDRDGKITVEEYAWYLQARDQRFKK